MRRPLAWVAAALVLGGCGSAAGPPPKQRRGGGIPAGLLREVRPIGRGRRYQPPAGGAVAGRCRVPLGRRLRAHVELFAADRVVLLPAGLGTRGPRTLSDGRVVRARCFGELVTLDPTGTVLVRPGGRPTVGRLFSEWGQPLGRRRVTSFGGGLVRVYVDGHRRFGRPWTVSLSPGAEVVIEIGPHVPPHARYRFAPAPSAALR